MTITPSIASHSIEPAAVGKYSYPGQVLPATSFAETASALEANGVRELRPVNGVKEAVLPVDGHYYSSQDRRLRSRATVASGEALAN